jgi:trans-aconitate methyltransferase
LEGGDSGTNYQREWTWETIDQIVNPYDDVIDVGCGDLSLWRGREAKNYTGIDISPLIIERNQKNRPDWNFICAPAEKKLEIPKAEIVQCLSVLFHIMDDQKYVEILKNLTRYSKHWIVILTWFENPFTSLPLRIRHSAHHLLNGRPLTAIRQPFNNSDDQVYQKYRRLEDYLGLFESSGFALKHKEVDKNLSKIGGLYFFEGHFS